MKGEKKQGVFSGSPAKAALAAVMMLLAVSGSAEAFEIVYSGQTVADIWITQEECGTNIKCELYRGSDLIGTWMNLSEDVFFSDTVSPDTKYGYEMKYYSWDSKNNKWYDTPNNVTNAGIDTTYMKGDLYNSENNPFQRPPVKWEGKIRLDKYDVGVRLWTGTFNFKAGDEISEGELHVHGKESTHSSPIPGQTPDAFISANGATLKISVFIYGIGETPVSSIFENCTIGTIRADENCPGMKIINNKISSINTGNYGYAEGNSLSGSLQMGSYSRVERNTWNAYIKDNCNIYVKDNCVVVDNNNLFYINVGNDNIVENNSCFSLNGGSRNQFLKNTFEDSMYLDNSTENLIRDNYIGGVIRITDAYSNTVTGNEIGNGIDFGGGGENVITDNTIAGKYYCIAVINSSDNRIEDNICDMFPSSDEQRSNDGIVILGTESEQGSFRNVVKNNKIKAVQNTDGSEENPVRIGICLNCPDYDIYSSNGRKAPNKCKNNEISGNTVEGFAVRGIEVFGNENTIYNNIFRNTTVGENTSPPKNQNAVDSGTGNLWNTAKQPETNIAGGPYLGGNYWDDYTGTDADKDGIGDTPYLFGVQDNFPLMLKGINSTGDDGDKDTADGLCDTGKTVVINGTETAECTLRAAIEEANAKAGEDKILFHIPGNGVPVITPEKELPAITEAVIIDGTSQIAGKAKIDGTNAGESHGININCNGTVLKGLEIANFRKNGICSAGKPVGGFEPLLNYGVSLDKVSVLNNRGAGIWTGGKITVTSGGATISDNSAEGILLSSSTGIEAENLEVSRNGLGGICFTEGELVGEGQPLIFRNVKVTGNKGEGIQAGGDVTLNGSNTVQSNSGTGISSVNGKIEIEQAVISENLGYGIDSGGSVIFTRRFSKITDNSLAGVVLYSNAEIQASDIEISGNGEGGITIQDGMLIGLNGPSVILENASVQNNAGEGILAYDIVLKGTNSVKNNGWTGLWAYNDIQIAQADVSGNRGNGIQCGNLTAANLTANMNGNNGIKTEKNVTVSAAGQSCGNAFEDIVAGGTLNLNNFVYGDDCEDEDEDGSDDVAEDNSCAGGDGNANGIPDRQEKDVVTFRDASGKCVTLVSCQGTTVTDFKVAENPSPGDAPAGVSFPSGFFSFITEGLTPGASCKMTLILHEHNQPESYWNYGGTPDNSSNHWYSFLYDGGTGAEIPAATAARSSDNPVMLNFSDGRRGDHDLKADGAVITLGGLTFRNGLDDLIKVLQLLTGKKVYDIAGIPDVNGDKKIGSEESVYILQKIADLR